MKGLVTEAAKDEMESSSCSLVTTPCLMLSTTSVFGAKGNCFVLKKSGPHPAIELQSFSGHTTRPSICRIITSSDVVPLVNAGVLQNFTNTICNEDGLFICRVYPLPDEGTICPHKYFIHSNRLIPPWMKR